MYCLRAKILLLQKTGVRVIAQIGWHGTSLIYMYMYVFKYSNNFIFAYVALISQYCSPKLQYSVQNLAFQA